MEELTEAGLILSLCLPYLIFKTMKKVKLTIIALLVSLSCTAQIEADLLVALTNATTAEMNAISGATSGSLLFNTTENVIFQYNGSAWVNTTVNGANFGTEN